MQITGSKNPFEAAINDPTIIPDNDKGKVRRRAAFIQLLAFDKLNDLIN
jgi:hypothetical protein